MYKKLVLTICAFCFCFSLYSQEFCKNILREAQVATKEKSYDTALDILKSAERCDIDNVLQDERLALQDIIFAKIREQKDEALEAKVKAEKATETANKEASKNERISRSSAIALQTLDMAETNPTKALRLAEINYHLFPESQAAAGILKVHLGDIEKAKYKENLDLRKDLQLVQSETNTQVDQTQLGHTDAVNAVAISPRRDLILTGSDDGLALLWNRDGKAIRQFEGHYDGVNAVAFSPDGQFVVTGGEDGYAVLWNVDAQVLQPLEGHAAAINAVTFSPDGQHILSGSSDGYAVLWNLNGEAEQVFEGAHYGAILAVAISPDGNYILTGSEDETAVLWDMEGNALSAFEYHDDFVTSVAFSPDGQYVLTGSDDATAILWNRDGTPVFPFYAHDDFITSVAFSPNGSYALTGSEDGTAILWNMEVIETAILAINSEEDSEAYDFEDEEVGVLRKFEMNSVVSSVAFSSDNSSILLGSRNSSASLFDLQGNPIASFSGNNPTESLPNVDPIEALLGQTLFSQELMTYSPDGKMLLAAMRDNSIKLWKLNGAATQGKSFGLPNENVQVIGFSPDAERILIGSAAPDSTSMVFRWDLEGNKLDTFKMKHIISSVAISKDPQYLFTGFNNGQVSKWNLQTKEALSTFNAHHDQVSAIAFSPKGESLLTGSHNGEAKLWDLNGKSSKIFAIKGIHSPIKALAFSPDGRFVLTGAEDGTARIWDCTDSSSHPSPIHSFQGHEFPIQDVQFSPDGSQVLTSSLDGIAKLWTSTGGLLKECIGHEDAVMASIFSSDGKQIQTASRDWTTKTWDVSDVENLLSMRDNADHEDHSPMYDLAVFPDKQWTVTGSSDGHVIIWDEEGKEKKKFEAHKTVIAAVAVFPDGQEILTGSEDGTAILWDTNGTKKKVFQGKGGPITSVAFSHDGKLILTGSADGTANLWDKDKKGEKSKQLYQGHLAGISAVAFSSDNTKVLTGSLDGTAKLWDLSGNVQQTYYGYGGEIYSVAFSPEPKDEYVLAGSEEGIGILWNANTTEMLRVYSGHNDWVNSVAFSPDGQQVLTASDDNTALLWDLDSAYVKQRFQGHSDFVNAIAVAPCKKKDCGFQVLTCSDDGTTRRWSLNSNSSLIFGSGKSENESAYSGEISCMAISPDGQQVLTGYHDGTIMISDRKREKITRFKGKHKMRVNAAVFSPNGKQVLTGSSDKKAMLWDISGKKMREFIKHEDSVYAVAFSPDGRHALTGSEDNTAIIWDLRTGQAPRVLKGHSGAIRAVAFSPACRNKANCEEYVLTGSKDGTAKVWNLQGKLLETLSQKGKEGIAIHSLASYPDSALILTGYEDGKILLWRYSDLLSTHTLASSHSRGRGEEPPEVSTGNLAKNVASLSEGDKQNNLLSRTRPSKKKITSTSLYTQSDRAISDMMFSNNGKLVLTGAVDGAVMLFDLHGHLIQSFDGEGDALMTVRFSSDEKKILTGSVDLFMMFITGTTDWNIQDWHTPGSYFKRIAGFPELELKGNLKEMLSDKDKVKIDTDWEQMKKTKRYWD